MGLERMWGCLCAGSGTKQHARAGQYLMTKRLENLPVAAIMDDEPTGRQGHTIGHIEPGSRYT